MSEKINEYVLKITGGSYLGKDVDLKKVILIKNAELTPYSCEYRDNQDGTYNKVIKAKITSEVDFEQGGERITGADKTAESRKTRYVIECLADELGEPDRTLFYKIFSQKLRKEPKRVWDFIKSF